MDLFSKTELLTMIAIVGAILLIIMVLTILDFIDERKCKKNAVKNNLDEDLKEEIKIEPKVDLVIKEETISISNMVEIEEIEVLDFDEPIIEMKEEPANNVVNEIAVDSVEEVTFNDLVLETQINVKESNIVEVTEDQERAKEELKKLEMELEKQEDFYNTITNFELEQEENAIISYDELVKISDKLYDQNEYVQYDEGNEPITIDEVIKRFSNSDMVFENTANLDKLNNEIENKDKNYLRAYENE